jgi:hypothetical protein
MPCYRQVASLRQITYRKCVQVIDGATTEVEDHITVHFVRFEEWVHISPQFVQG